MDTRALLTRIRSDWVATRPGLEPTPMLRLILLARAARLAADRVERVQHQHGLNHAHTDLLFTLYRSAPPEGLTPMELTRLAAVTPSSITNRIDGLEAQGLVERTPHPTDARSRRVRLTPAGRARVEALLPEHLGNETELLAGLSEAEQQELDRLLLKLVGHLEGG